MKHKHQRFGAPFAALLLAAALLLSGCSAQGIGTLRVGVKGDVANFGLYDAESDRYSGLEIDLARLLCEQLGYRDVAFTTVDAATREALIDDGSLDMIIATYSITPERQERYDFSTPYYTDTTGVMVERSSLIDSITQLTGCRVGTMKNSSNALEMARYMAGHGIVNRFATAQFSPATFHDGLAFVEFDSYAGIAQALEYGDVDAFLADGSILTGYRSDDRLILNDVFSTQQYGVCTKKGSSLSGRVDEAIRTWQEDGTLTALCEKWGV